MALFRRKSQASEAVQIQEMRERHNMSQQVFFRREAMGWSQAKLAERCETTQAQIANIEAGRVNVTFNTMVKLAHAFGCLAHDLLRPFQDEAELERPEARDWARWSKDRPPEQERAPSVPVSVAAYMEVAGRAVYFREANDRMALTT